MSYAKLAQLSDNSDIIASARVKRAITLPPERAPNVAIGNVRIYVEAEILGLIRGQGGLPESIRYLVDMPLDARGKAPKIKKKSFLLFARRGGSPAELQLLGPDAQQPWSQTLNDRVRAITQQLLAADAPPVITGVKEAFHVPGNLQGEGETQIFLNTPNGDPVSISILRRPRQTPVWAVSLSEIVDASATRPRRDTPLWYRLACGLPREIPDDVLFSADNRANMIAREDYSLVLRDLGPCE
ncbi:hypothetical protein [Alterisphingorhabdus coralli]|uniref:Uncharacterized protein n=1 Tax=Alterisphingorhabdus coralli TaxID=3071408 RepID=A0AA97I1K8_9SPHN|nr:hypothetical protein [Parasphingorhabdus sp. SCSIO 66989]WOE74855.1 hypothetical protein RB602_13580 [Parasphingorhabdus sp. SCSIO 66989]